MRYDVDLSLFERTAHSPSMLSLMRSMSAPSPDLVDFCIPCNPYFPTGDMLRSYAASLETTLKYYPSDNATIARRLAETLGVSEEALVLSNGSTELITWITALLVESSLATPVPTFGLWVDLPSDQGKLTHLFQLRPEDGFRLNIDGFVSFVRRRGAPVVVVCNPNNPDGQYVRKTDILRLLDELADIALVIIDESFIDFVTAEDSPSVADEACKRSNVIVLKSLGKCLGLHGIRLGYSLSNPRIAARLRRALPFWNVNAVAEAVIYSLADQMGVYRNSLKRIAHDRRSMRDRLERVDGLQVFPSQANYLLSQLPHNASGVDCRNFLLREHGLFVRECGNKCGITSQFLRAAVRPPRDVIRLVDGMESFLKA